MVVDAPHWVTVHGPCQMTSAGGWGLHWMPDVNGDCRSVVDDGCSILDVNTWKMSSSLTLAWDLFLKALAGPSTFTEK